MRWSTNSGPGAHRQNLETKFKRWILKLATRDKRFRRLGLSHIFSQHVAGGVLCLVPFKDHKVFVDPRDDRIAYTLLSGEEWERESFEAAISISANKRAFSPDSVFVDVGANIGLLTIYAMLSGRFARAVAIEPDAWNRSILQQNLEINGLSDVVTVLDKAVSSQKGSMTFHRDQMNLGAHSLEPGFTTSPGETDVIEVDTLDNLLRHIAIPPDIIGFVKIDVEGHELSVLEGMPRVLASSPSLMVEATFDARGSAGRSGVMDRLRRLVGDHYSACCELGDPNKRNLRALSSFQPNAIQHELLITR